MVSRVRKYAKYAPMLTVAVALVGSILGMGAAVLHDRSNVETRLTTVETRAEATERTSADRLNTVHARISGYEQRWDHFEARVDKIGEDVAMTKAIVERLEKHVASPAANPLSRQLQQDEKHGPLTEGQHVRK